MSEEPQFEMWFVVEVDTKFNCEEPIHARLLGLFESENHAEREKERKKEA